MHVVAGIDQAAIRAEWLATVSSHLIFGLPATAAAVRHHRACAASHAPAA